jgi:hypothetical protein
VVFHNGYVVYGTYLGEDRRESLIIAWVGSAQLHPSIELTKIRISGHKERIKRRINLKYKFSGVYYSRLSDPFVRCTSIDIDAVASFCSGTGYKSTQASLQLLCDATMPL